MANFFDDLLFELLSLLPIDSLIRFMCVSKSWYRLIRSPYFSRIHHLKQQKFYQTRYFSPKIISLKDYQLHFIDFSNNADFRYTKISNVPFLKNFKNLMIKELQSCNGVLCLHCQYRKVIIWNPISNKYRKLHAPIAQSGSRFSFGFGYDRITGDYKLVALQVFVDDINIHDNIVPHASVYSVKSGKWKDIDGFNYRLENPDDGVFLRDSVHWVTKSKCIIAFDLTTDQFHEIPLPSFCCDIRCTNIIGVLSDRLTLTCRYKYSCTETLYVMKSYETKDCWESLRLELPAHHKNTYHLKPIACMDEILVIQEGTGSLILYDTEKKSTLTYFCVGETHSYIPTLGFYGGKLDDAGEEGGKTKRVLKALSYRTSNKRAKL